MEAREKVRKKVGPFGPTRGGLPDCGSPAEHVPQPQYGKTRGGEDHCHMLEVNRSWYTRSVPEGWETPPRFRSLKKHWEMAEVSLIFATTAWSTSTVKGRTSGNKGRMTVACNTKCCNKYCGGKVSPTPQVGISPSCDTRWCGQYPACVRPWPCCPRPDPGRPGCPAWSAHAYRRTRGRSGWASACG